MKTYTLYLSFFAVTVTAALVLFHDTESQSETTQESSLQNKPGINKWESKRKVTTKKPKTDYGIRPWKKRKGPRTKKPGGSGGSGSGAGGGGKIT